MTKELPFDVPPVIDPGLARVAQAWRNLRRGQAEIPFADDVKLSALQDADVDLMIIDVFQRPVRFRITIAGRHIAGEYGQLVEGLFVDEILPQAPLDYLLSQCSATVERKSPTFYGGTEPSHSRLMLPLWGDGHVNSLLVAVSFS